MVEPAQTLQAIAHWTQGGEAACLSSTTAHIIGYPQPAAIDALTQSLQALVLSLTSSSKIRLAVDAVVQFLVSLLAALPSSSAHDPRSTLNAILIDVIWAVDVGLEDSLPSVSSKAELPPEVKTAYDTDRQTLASFVRALVVRSVIPALMCRQSLEVGLLGLADLLDDAAAFERRTIRVRTAVNYKQTNYNLLREQSEGYSKLITEVVALIGPPHDSATGLPVESGDELRSRARKAWDNVVGLIGYFDLNANRVLDVIIDIFAGHALTHYAFFVELLRLTTWALPSSESQYDRKARGALPPPIAGQYEGMEFDDIIQVAEKRSRDLDGPQIPTTCVLGQIIGFKFAQFQLHDLGEQKLSPRKLYFVTALLIREGLVSLEDVYPHLSPSDDDMERGLAKYHANMKDKMAAAQSSGGPSMGDAAPLRDGGPSYRTPAPTSKPRAGEALKPTPTATVREPVPQKLNVLRTLVGMGALRPAFLILSKFEWLPDAYPEVADQFLYMVNASLAPLITPRSTKEATVQRKNKPLSERTIVEAGMAPTAVPKKRQLVASCPLPRSNNYTEFVYFYPAWLDTLPLCTTGREIFTVIEPLLRFTGIQCYRDIDLLTKLCRLGKSQLSEAAQFMDSDATAALKDQWRNMLRRYMLPALSLTRANSAFNLEIWSLLCLFNSRDRWGMYGEWSQAHMKYPELKVRHVEVTRETRSILRRVTVNGNNKLSLPLAKLAHGNPCIVFTECVKQAMAYDNLIEAIAESARSLTPLGYDVLVWCILTAFSNSSKPRMKEDGTSVALWLQSLSTYTAIIYKKFGGHTDPAPVLEYVAHRLKNFRSSDLIVLRELISKTANIQPQANLTDDQVISIGGGPALRIEALAPDTRGSGSLSASNSNEQGMKRLLEALNKAQLLLPMMILIAQQREFCVEKVDRSEEHLKHISNLYDDCQAILFQYVEFLITALGSNYASILPPLDELCEKMSIRPDIAFHLYRPALRDPVTDQVIGSSDEKAAKEKAIREEKERLLKQQLAKRAASNAANTEEDKPMVNGDTAAPSTVEDASSSTPVDQISAVANVEAEPAPQAETKIQPWVPRLHPLIESAKKILPQRALRVITPGFYVTFWQMSMWDLSPTPMRKIYERETSRIRSLVAIASKSRSAERHLLVVYHNIMEEQKKCHRMQKATLDRLEAERSHWFRKHAATHAVVQQLALTCMYPRSLLSPTDAEFSAKFMKTLHDVGTPGYSTIAAYANLFGAHLGDMILSLSEHQTQNLGRFYRIVLEDLDLLCNDESLFRGGKPDSTVALPGFQRRFTVKDKVTYESLFHIAEFRKLCGTWRERLANALLQLLESRTYIGVRNAVIFLSMVANRFPRRASHGERIIAVLDSLATSEKRPDLQALIKSYTATLKNRKSSWEQDTVRENASKPQILETATLSPAAASATVVSEVRPDPNVLSTAMSISTASAASFTSAFDSVEKPAVIKRINRVNGNEADSSRPSTPDIAAPIVESNLTPNLPARPKPAGLPSSPSRVDVTQSPRHINAGDDLLRRKPDMPPPAAPSSTPLATGLRTQAQIETVQDVKDTSTDLRDHSRSRTPTELSTRVMRNKSPSPHSASRSRPPSPTRSEERHRTSATAYGRDWPLKEDEDRQRSAKIVGAADRERKERDSRFNTKDAGRDVHDRDRDRDRERERDRDRGRDRDRDRERERERERDHRDRDRAGERRDRHAESDRERDRERERDRDRNKGRDRDPERDRARDGERSSRRDGYGDTSRRGHEKDEQRASRREGARAADDLGFANDRDRNRGLQDDNPNKRRRDEEDGDSSKRRRGNEGSPYVPSDKDRERETASNGRSERQHERGTRRERPADGSRTTHSGADASDKRDSRRDRRERLEDKANGSGRGRDGDSKNSMPSSPPGRAPPTGPRSERERENRGEDAPQRLADRLAPALAPSRNNVGDEQPSRRGGERSKGRDHSPPNQEGASTLPASGEGDTGGGHSRKRVAGDGQRMMFERAVATAAGTGAGPGAAGSKRVKIDRRRRAAANKE